MPKTTQNEKRKIAQNPELNRKLQAAAQGNKTAEARAFLDLGANPRAVGVEGRTALMSAADRGAIDCVKLLIPLSNLEKRSAAPEGWTALQLAASSAEAACAKLLVEAGAIAGLDKNGSTLFELICLADRAGRSAEARACVQALKAVIDFSGRNQHGLSPLGHAARYATPLLVDAVWRETPPEERFAALLRSRQERFWASHDRFLARFEHQDILEEFSVLARDIPTLASEQNFPKTHEILRRREDARAIRNAIEEGRNHAESLALGAEAEQKPSSQTPAVSAKASGRRL